MNVKDNYISDNSFKKLLNNEHYYKHIFKKTEKIISVVFYILNNTDPNKKSETLFSNIASKAHFAHEHSLRSLEVKLTASKEVLEQFAQALVGLDSTLRIASSGGVLANDVLTVLTTEIDIVLRGLRSFLLQNNSNEVFFKETGFGMSTNESQQQTHEYRVPKVKRTASVEGTATASQAGLHDRRTRIKTILEAKKEATIKDISEIITDVSEKTIQRELNAMIDENLVQRQGERRWSRYLII